MSNKNIFQGMSSWSQLFFLLLFVFGGIIFSVLLMLICGGGSIERMQSIDFLRVMQLVQVTCLFLLPALLCARLFHERPCHYLKIDKRINPKFLFFSVLLIVSIQPLISFTGYYNSLMTLPDSLSGLEMWMKEMEQSSQALMERFLTTDSFITILFNIFIIAIMAGIAEELFFRGSMQQIFRKICKNRHVAIWITAVIFSAIHFQFYGFVPRVILGAVLGYLFVWSGNLWIPIIIHTLNNFMSILIFQLYYGTPMYEQAESFGTGDTIWITGVSLVVSGVILYLLSREYQKNNLEDFTI